MAKNKHPLFHRWKDLTQACYSVNNPNYKWAGARGIQVNFTDFWEFVEFVETHLGLPKPGDRLHRIDQNGHYEPGNLMWSNSRDIVNKTKRLHNRFILRDFCNLHGFKYSTVRTRLSNGQTFDQILQNPPPRYQRITNE